MTASGRDKVTLKRGKDYTSLTATHGGTIRGSRVDVEGRSGELVKAIDGGKIELVDTDVSADGKSRHSHHVQQGPAVSATSNDNRHSRGRDTEVSLKGGSVTTQASNSPALQASGRNATVSADGTRLKTYGNGSDVAKAVSGGTVELRNVSIKSQGRDADGVAVHGNRSSATLYRTEIETRGSNADGVEVTDGGQARVDRSEIKTSGASAAGLRVDGRNSDAELKRSEIRTRGASSSAVEVSRGGDVEIEDSELSTSGSGSAGIRVDGRGSDASVRKTEIRTSGSGASGIVLSDKAQANVSRSSISTSGRDSDGVAVGSGAELRMSRSHIGTSGRSADGLSVQGNGSKAIVDDLKISTTGKDSKALSVKNGGLAVVTDSELSTSGSGSAGIRVDGRGSDASVRKTEVRTSGSDASGIVLSDKAQANVSRSSISTSGRDSDGVAVGSGAELRMSRSQIGTSGRSADGLSVQGSGSKAIADDLKISASGKDSKALSVKSGGLAVVTDSEMSANGENGIAAAVSGEGARALILDSELTANGQDGQALEIKSSGFAYLADSVAVGSVAGATVTGSGSLLVAKNSQISAQAQENIYGRGRYQPESPIGLNVTKGGKALVLGGDVQAQGDDARGINVSGKGSSVWTVDTDIAATGQDSQGVAISKGAGAALLGSTVSADAIGISVDGRDSSLLAINTTVQAGTDTQIYTRRSDPAPGVGIAVSGGATAAVLGGQVTALGDGGAAVKVENSLALLKDVTLDATGNDANALIVRTTRDNDDRRGRRGHDRDRNEAGAWVSGATVSTSGDRSDAVLVQGRKSVALIEGSTITTTGEQASGLSVQDGGQVGLADSRVSASGAGAAAARVGSVVSRHHRAVSSLEISGSTLSATGENASGIVLENSANLSIANSVVRSTGASLTSRLDTAGQRQNISIDSGATLVQNNGTLLQVERSEEGRDGRVNLDLKDGSVTKGNIVDIQQDLVGDGGTYVRLGALASYDGLMQGVREVVTEGGNQTLHFADGSTLGSLLIDNHAVSSGGTVDNRISASGDVVVDNATLGGNWKIGGTLTGRNGAIIRPGNSVGAITTNAIDWQAGSVYQAEINAQGQSDLVEVTGSGGADISKASLVVKPENGVGRVLLNHDYTVLTAASGVQGKFTATSWDGQAYPLLALSTIYAPQSVAVRMAPDTGAIKNYGFSRNQRGAALGSATLAGSNASVDEAFFSANPRNAFDQLSGEVHASVRSILFNDMLSTSAAMQGQMRANLGAQMLPGQPTASTDAASPDAMPVSGAYPLWASFNAAGMTTNDDGNAASTRYSTTRLLVGGDAAIGGGWRLGAAAGVSSGDFKLNDRNSDGSVNNYTMMLYGGNAWKAGPGSLKLLVGGGYTRHNIDTSRTVDLAGSQDLDADYNGSTWQLFGDLGYAIALGDNYSVEPYVNVAWFKQRLRGFDESGGDAALKAGSSREDLGTYTLGLRTALVYPGKTNPFTLRGHVGWRHATGDRDPSRSMSFVQGGGSAFSVYGSPIAKNAAVVGLSGEVGLDKNFALGLSYDGQFGSGNTDNAGSLFMKVRF
ncbi:autotransporter domain-containing protein [Achromobacter veterisilvae]|uniref:autotransporter domain-containing protein n=1 Tax=Achromobacter veterisilvae TaxID=2069367 RepID=UPI00100F1ED5|nr:autotransporter domain-containing protein [Achromobacter veterisilvae]